MATRAIAAAGDQQQQQQLVFDHAAQFFTASDERFKRVVDEWMDKGLVREWGGLIGELDAGGHFRPMPSSSPPRYIGVDGMRPLADAILPEVYPILTSHCKSFLEHRSPKYQTVAGSYYPTVRC